MSQIRRAPSPAMDPLDLPDYNPVGHLNMLFPTSSTLSSLPQVSAGLKHHTATLTQQINDKVRAQEESNNANLAGIERAKQDLTDLFHRIEGVAERARVTEEGITKMTGEIKRLDSGKRNLTVSMTVLKRLQMLTTAYEQLRTLGKTRQYKECAQLLQAVMQLMAHFKSYRSIDQIATLSRGVADLQRELLEQVCEDFELIFAKGEIANKRATLKESCAVVDALGEPARNRVVMWYCNTMLREYRQIFRGNDEAGSLDNISRRYAWLKRILKTYDEEHVEIFPESWKVNEILTITFCEGTKEDYRGILSRFQRKVDGKSLDVDLLLRCLQETLEFEHWLEQRFAGEAKKRPSLDTADGKDGIFGKAISEAFEPYLSLWVDAQDKTLSSMLPKYRTAPLIAEEEEFTQSSVAPSSIELFQFYRISFGQCATLSTGQNLLDLSLLFGKYLDFYAEQVLLGRIQAGSSPQNMNQNLSIQDAIIILNTAEYCQTTTAQLATRISGKLNKNLTAPTYESQQDSFLSVINTTIKLLVARVLLALEQPFREMRNMPWTRLESVSDQSPHVTQIITLLHSQTKPILTHLHTTTHSRAFLSHLASTFLTTYLTTLLASRPITDLAAEQNLLDIYILKSSLSDLSSYLPSSNSTTSQAFYPKLLTTLFSKPNALLKTLQLPSTPPQALIQGYALHIGDRNIQNFKKVLEIKGITARREVSTLTELFNGHIAASAELTSSNPTIGGLSPNTSPHPSRPSSPKPVAVNANASPDPSISLFLSQLTLPDKNAPLPVQQQSQGMLPQGLGLQRSETLSVEKRLEGAARMFGDRIGKVMGEEGQGGGLGRFFGGR